LGGLSFEVLHVGKTRIPFVRSGVEHFQKKIKPYASLSLTPLREEPLRKGISVQEVLRKERERFEKHLQKGIIGVALDQKGRILSSDELATLIKGWMEQGHSRPVFIIGGPYGLAPEVLEQATLSISLSSMTFSHEMTLLVLLEQLYRSLAIIHGLPYPK